MRLVGYLRVSSIGQVNDGFGLDLQRSAIEMWAENNGHTVSHWCSDAAVSGTMEASNRPGFIEALSFLSGKETDGFIAYDMTRIARDLMVQEVALGLLWQHSDHIFTTATGLIPPDDTSDPTRTLVRQMLGALAQFERATITGRLARGKIEAAKRGQRTNGRWPYGYHPQRLDERAGRLRILSLHAQGLTPTEIAHMMNAEKWATRIDGAQWHTNTIKNILKHSGKLKYMITVIVIGVVLFIWFSYLLGHDDTM
jgi:DNA invertase Pin-like site-specific DNA recombinase